MERNWKREMHIAVQKAVAPIILDSNFRADGWESRQMEDVAIASARAALASMLEAVGEPVAVMHEHNDEMTDFVRYANGAGCLADGDREAGWTETPLYSLAALREEL